MHERVGKLWSTGFIAGSYYNTPAGCKDIICKTMANTSSPNELPPIDTNNADAHDREYLATQLAQHARLKNFLPFLRSIDMVDENIRQIVEK